MANPRILIAGIGNIFLGDDAFGVEVVRRLGARPLGDAVRVVDFGIRGLDLVYALLDGYETVILVDAAPRGEQPGTLYVLKPESPGAPPAPTSLDPNALQIDMHGLDPGKVLRLVQALGGQVERIFLVGCEPAEVGSDKEMSMELSKPVQMAVQEAVPLIETLVARLLDEQQAAIKK